MIFEIAVVLLCVLLMSGVAVLTRKYDKLIRRVGKVAMKVADLEMTVNRVDESTGAEIHRLREEFLLFRQDYGDAAIDQMREEAKAQKAWADGLNDIMSFGANLHGRGD